MADQADLLCSCGHPLRDHDEEAHSLMPCLRCICMYFEPAWEVEDGDEEEDGPE